MTSSDTLHKMYQDVFASRRCTACEPIEGLNPEGSCFSIDSAVGQGWCWVYQCGEHASITVMDQVYREDTYCQMIQPDFLCIGYYYSVSGEQIHPYRRLTSSSFHAHIGKAGYYGFVHHKGIPIRSISLTLMPEYYENHLQDVYGSSYENPRDAFASIDGIKDFPALLLVFNQIRNYRGSGMSARLYYESKLDEAISLVVQKSHETYGNGKKVKHKLSPEDKEAMAAVAAYIDNHYMTDVPQAMLAQIACMSPAKLKYTFKAVYACTISAYIQTRRIGHAEHLLSNTELTIAQIANAVGYKKAGSLTEAFKKHTDMTPNEYRTYSQDDRPC